MNAKQALALSLALAATAAVIANAVLAFVMAGAPGVALYVTVFGATLLFCGLEMLRRTG